MTIVFEFYIISGQKEETVFNLWIIPGVTHRERQGPGVGQAGIEVGTGPLMLIIALYCAFKLLETREISGGMSDKWASGRVKWDKVVITDGKVGQDARIEW